MAIKTTVGRTRTINASVGEPNTPQVTRVTASASVTSMRNLTDVDSSQLADGSVLVYNNGLQKWETINTLEKQIMEGGNF